MFCGQVFGPGFLQLPLSGGMCSDRAEPVFSPQQCQGTAPSQVQRMLGVDLGVNVPWHTQKMLDSQKFCCTKVATWALPFSSSPWPLSRCSMAWESQSGRKEPSLGFQIVMSAGKKHQVLRCVSPRMWRGTYSVAHGTQRSNSEAAWERELSPETKHLLAIDSSFQLYAVVSML